MDKAEVLSLLPTSAPSSLEEYTYERYLQELGGHMAIYRRVSYSVTPELKAVMGPEDWDEYAARTKNIWAAECTCTCCQESWYTAWAGGPLKSIVVCVGEYGITYPVHDLEDPDVAPFLVQLSHNDGTLCPVCGENVTLVHASKIKSGSTRRLALCTVENIGRYTGLMYWLAYRHIDSCGVVCEEITPWCTWLLDEGSKLLCFRYSRSGWRPSSTKTDPFFAQYTSGDGNMYNFKRGGFVRNDVPDLVGFTGEKTGLGEYVRQGGQYPLLYLRTWQRKPAIENLVNTGWAPLVESLLAEETQNGACEIREARLLDINWSSSKPHEMLRIDKAAFRQLSRTGADHRRKQWLRLWHQYQSAGGRLSAADFDSHYCKFTAYGIETVLGLMFLQPGVDLPKISRYLEKQQLKPAEVRLLADTWRMTTSLYGRRELSHEELWPKHLIERHDQLAALNLIEKSKDSWVKYLDGFRRISDKYGDLQWTDGDLRILLPKDNGELVHEGAVLRHCVGTYGESHVTEEQTIFFVRRYKRPERCYYTLSMDLRGVPRWVQLHGYGNERHGPNKQYRHSIPKKVLDFCDRWEKEILMPWYRDKCKQGEMRGETA